MILIISVLIFAAFLSVMWFLVKNPETGKVFGIQPSISATYKLLLLRFKEQGAAQSIWLFMFFILAVGIISAGQNAWYFGSAIGLVGVAAFPSYWEKKEVKKHISAAYLAFLLPTVYMLFFDGKWHTTVLSAAWLVFAILCSRKFIAIKNHTTVYEVVGFIVILIGLM